MYSSTSEDKEQQVNVPQTIQVTSTVFTSVATMCSVTQKYFQFQVKSERHWQAANDFMNLSMDISAQLVIAPNLRVPVQDFVKDLVTRRAVLMQSEPLLS
jgi:hypothetical protein